MKYRKTCMWTCLTLSTILIVAFSIQSLSKEPTVSSQLFAVNKDGIKQEILSTEPKDENSDFCRSLMEDLENLEWVNSALVFCECHDETTVYYVAVIYDSNDGNRYEDLLFALNQYVKNFSVNDKTIYEDQIHLTFVME